MVNTTFRKVAFTFWLTALNLAAAAHLSAQPTATVVDSIVLEESGDDYLALPAPVIPDGTDGPPVSTEAMWVSVIDASLTRACPDGLIPLEDGSHPAIGFEGDLLLVLDQVIRGGDAETVVRRIKVETDDCEWVPLSR